ncbi:MAG: hypothetical protein KGL57_01535 [Burkholderiales bacterium]|nr:hypothetical protein [Burkholderiales bacterium]
MRTRSTLILLAMACSTATPHAATQTAPATPAAVVTAQAFRCQDESGGFRYQQWACSSEAGAQQVNIKDSRTDEQRAQAHRMAVREQDLARHVSYVRRQEEHRSLDATAKAKRLTIAPRHVAPATTSITQGVTVVPRKRDFRAVSAKTEKRAKKSKAQTKASPSHQTG